MRFCWNRSLIRPSYLASTLFEGHEYIKLTTIFTMIVVFCLLCLLVVAAIYSEFIPDSSCRIAQSSTSTTGAK